MYFTRNDTWSFSELHSFTWCLGLQEKEPIPCPLYGGLTGGKILYCQLKIYFMNDLQTAFGFAKLLKLSNITGLGLLAIGACPGGGGSNIFAYLLDADLELSITMTFVSTICALGKFIYCILRQRPR